MYKRIICSTVPISNDISGVWGLVTYVCIIQPKWSTSLSTWTWMGWVEWWSYQLRCHWVTGAKNQVPEISRSRFFSPVQYPFKRWPLKLHYYVPLIFKDSQCISWGHNFRKQIETHWNTVACGAKVVVLCDLPRANDFAVSLGTLQVAQRRDCEVEDRDDGIWVKRKGKPKVAFPVSPVFGELAQAMRLDWH